MDQQLIHQLNPQRDNHLSHCLSVRHIWCLDFKGGLFCSSLPETGLTWQRFEDNVHQVALSPSGELVE